MCQWAAAASDPGTEYADVWRLVIHNRQGTEAEVIVEVPVFDMIPPPSGLFRSPTWIPSDEA